MSKMPKKPPDNHAYDHAFHNRKLTPARIETPKPTPLPPGEHTIKTTDLVYDHAGRPVKLKPDAEPRPVPPHGLSDRIYVVIRPGGERHYIEKMSPKELAEWAKGLDVTIVAYRYGAIIHTPPPPKKPVG